MDIELIIMDVFYIGVHVRPEYAIRFARRNISANSRLGAVYGPVGPTHRRTVLWEGAT